MLDYEIHAGSRTCHETGRKIAPGEEYYSALVPEAGELLRRDYSLEAWQGPPEGAAAHWKTRVPESDRADRLVWASAPAMIEFFESISDDPAQADLRYVAALLLVRRRTLRLESTRRDEKGREMLFLVHGASRTEYEVEAVALSPERETAICEILTASLCTSSTGPSPDDSPGERPA